MKVSYPFLTIIKVPYVIEKVIERKKIKVV
jgi:hypothetical protein